MVDCESPTLVEGCSPGVNLVRVPHRMLGSKSGGL